MVFKLIEMDLNDGDVIHGDYFRDLGCTYDSLNRVIKVTYEDGSNEKVQKPPVEENRTAGETDEREKEEPQESDIVTKILD